MKQERGISTDCATAVLDLIKNHKGRFVTAWFRKKNQPTVIRKMNFRLGVTKGVTGAGMKFNPFEKGLLPVAEMITAKDKLGHFQGQGFQRRMVNIPGLLKLRFNGKEIIVPENF
jgi:hypothetical protein